jgi:Anti-sigma-K factor rskA
VSGTDDDRISYLAGDAVESLSAQERAQLDEVREALREPATWAEPDAGLEDRIVAAIAEEARARLGAEAGARPGEEASARPGEEAGARRGEEAGARPGEQADAAETAPAPAEPARRRRGRRFSLGELFRRPSYAFGGLAAAVAVAVVAIVLATGGKNSPKPLHFAMVVTGTQLAPRAKGNASLTKTDSGWRIELSATGLPHIQDGRYYQAWLKNAAGVLVPVGTFNDARKVTLWSGVPVTKFRTLTVTIQPANGNPISSGKRVLIGRIAPRG